MIATHRHLYMKYYEPLGRPHSTFIQWFSYVHLLVNFLTAAATPLSQASLPI